MSNFYYNVNILQTFLCVKFKIIALIKFGESEALPSGNLEKAKEKIKERIKLERAEIYRNNEYLETLLIYHFRKIINTRIRYLFISL